MYCCDVICIGSSSSFHEVLSVIVLYFNQSVLVFILYRVVSSLIVNSVKTSPTAVTHAFIVSDCSILGCNFAITDLTIVFFSNPYEGFKEEKYIGITAARCRILMIFTKISLHTWVYTSALLLFFEAKRPL